MTKNNLKEKALKMRAQGMSYSQIRDEIKVSKSSLSYWLREYPLSQVRMSELRDNSPVRIEKYRQTMALKRQTAFSNVYEKVSCELGTLSKRDLLLGGLFLYWGEGTKSAEYCTSVSNTDPAVLKFFIRWLKLFGINKKDLRVTLHLYSDMSLEKELAYWSKILKLPRSCFGKAYIKHSKLSELTYKNGFGHGTCNVKYYDKNMWMYSQMALKYIREGKVW